MKLTKQSTTQIPTQTNTDKNATSNQEAVINKDKITCPTYKKEFSTPLFSIDYNLGNPKLIRLCPYCNQTLDSETKTLQTRIFGINMRQDLDQNFLLKDCVLC